jgi:uncharacterized protein YrrD
MWLLNMENYSIGDDVVVKLPNGEMRGKVVEILLKYSWGEETKYRVSGDNFSTITSARTMRKNGRLF